MKFDKPLVSGKWIKRYKRFLVDTEINNKVVTVFCPNTGSMRTCFDEGWPVLLHHNPSPKRKYDYTVELIHNGSCWICINTHRANPIVYEALSNQAIPELREYTHIQKEVPWKTSRLDFTASSSKKTCYIEVKSVTLLENNYYQFPDSPTKRGQKHLQTLIDIKKEQYEAMMIFIIQRSDAKTFKPAEHIDPTYANLLKKAHQSDVKILALQTQITKSEIKIYKPIPIILN